VTSGVAAMPASLAATRAAAITASIAACATQPSPIVVATCTSPGAAHGPNQRSSIGRVPTRTSTVPAGGAVSHDVFVQTFGGCAGSETFTYQATGLVCTDPPALQASFNIAGTSVCFCS